MNTTERRLRDAKLGAAIENAAGKLPDGWNVCITIEGGGYAVSLFDPGGNDIEMDWSDSLADDVVNAVAEAIAIASAPVQFRAIG